MISKYCVACTSTDNLHNHHLVPRSRGGGDEETNLITLCGGCHAKVHGKDDMWVNHRDLTKAGLQAAKNRGVVLGTAGPTNLKRKVEERQAAANEFAGKLKGVIEGMKTKGLSQRAMRDELNSLGVKTARGGQWTQMQLQRVMARLTD